ISNPLRNTYLIMRIRASNQVIVLAIILIIVGLLTIFLPWYILPVCEAADKSSPGMADMHMDKGVIMKCGYTARGEIGLGILGVLLGLTLLILPRREARRAVGIQTIGVGIITILLPTVLIGVCGTPTAPCVIGTKPGLILLGTITIIIGVILVATRDLGDSSETR
ncbi:MAG TPA: DUF4418 family protein, partial [Methanospirillum sp.]|uniref:DUF4418 family protein n=1 Tax=Methanospirillum sp. TaxID=45200 RepID=UPI002D0BCD97